MRANLFGQRVAWAAVLCAVLTVGGALMASPVAGAENDFVDLLAGGLGSWQQRGGVADYALKDGVLVGTAVADTPNSFLCTRRRFSVTRPASSSNLV